MNPEIDKIILGDCRDVMKTYSDNFFHSVVCDPPYELKPSKSAKIGFMGKAWDGTGIAYDVSMWEEVLRVLKPGGHLLAFGGDRTHHRMFCAIEDAGFEIRRTIAWTFGSGFPKSLDISKQLDKMAGVEREVVGKRTRLGDTKPHPDKPNVFNALGGNDLTMPVSGDAKQWSGWGSDLKPAFEAICLARKPLDCKTIAENVIRWGVGGLNIDGCRIGTSGGSTQPSGMDRYNAKLAEQGYRPNEYQQGEPSAPFPAGRFPSNLIWSHSPLCKRIGTKKVKGSHKPGPTSKTWSLSYLSDTEGVLTSEILTQYTDADGMETVETWDCHPSCPSWEFAKAGESKSQRNDSPLVDFRGNNYGRAEGKKLPGYERGYTDQGTPARFFKSCSYSEEDMDIAPFIYVAKASRAEREKGLDGLPKKFLATMGDGIGKREHNESEPSAWTHNYHPTVKPLTLMRYLCRLITPPNGLILDPFGGSGTTAVAAIREGFHYILIEREPEYVEIANRRISAMPTRLDNWAKEGDIK